jgi:hypothetical protein
MSSAQVHNFAQSFLNSSKTYSEKFSQSFISILGKEAVKIPAFMGIGLSLLDGGMSYSDLGALALAAVGATTNELIATTVWRNLYGTNPTLIELNPIIKQLNEGLKPGDYVVSVGDSALNATNIGLVGLVQTGIEFIPT